MKLCCSELITNFSWDVPKPFHIVPSNGVLQPKSAYDFKAAFCPSSAVVFKVTAVCRYGLDLKEVMTLDGIGMCFNDICCTIEVLAFNYTLFFFSE